MSKPHASFRKALVAGVAALTMVISTAGLALAAGNGAGAFEGHEHAPASVLVNPAAFCAQFDPSLPGSDNLEHHLVMEGTFHGSVGVGTAEFSSSNSYYASPQGTFAVPTARCRPPSSAT